MTGVGRSQSGAVAFCVFLGSFYMYLYDPFKVSAVSKFPTMNKE